LRDFSHYPVLNDDFTNYIFGVFFSGFTEEEREFSQNAILRQQQANHTDTHEDIDEEDEEDLDDTGHGKDNFFLHSFYRLFLFRSYIFFYL
jgi:hypothetical protein